MDIKKEFNYREIELIGRNPKTGEDVVVKREVWTYKGYEFTWNCSFINDYKDIELTSLDLSHIKEEISGALELDDIEEDTLKELQLSLDVLKQDSLNLLDKIFVCYVYDSNFYSWIGLQYYRDEVESIRNTIGNYEYMLYSKFYPEEDDEEEMD